MFDLLFGAGRSQHAAGAEEAQRAGRNVEHLEAELARVEERLEKMSTITLALWTLVKQNTSLTDEQLSVAVGEIEAQKQQSAQVPLKCPQCGRAMLARDRRCLYCDYREPEGDVLSQV